MDKKKLEVIRNELVKFINGKEFGNDIGLFEVFEVMHNVNKFLDPDTYEENIKVLNSIKKFEFR